MNNRRIAAWITAIVALWMIVGGKVYHEHLRVRARVESATRDDRSWSSLHGEAADLMVAINRLIVTWRNLAANGPDRDRFAVGWSKLDAQELAVVHLTESLRERFATLHLSESRLDPVAQATTNAVPLVRGALEGVRSQRAATLSREATELVTATESEAITAVRGLVEFINSEHDSALSLRGQQADVDHTWARNSYAFLFAAGAIVSALGLWLAAASAGSQESFDGVGEDYDDELQDDDDLARNDDELLVDDLAGDESETEYITP